MRRIPRRTQRILDELRQDAAPRFRVGLKSADEVRREAREALTLRAYADKPVRVGEGLARRLRG